MAVLDSNQRALLIARIGCARIGAFRIGFIPVKVDKATYPATSGLPYYIWRQVTLPTTTWTNIAS